MTGVQTCAFPICSAGAGIPTDLRQACRPARPEPQIRSGRFEKILRRSPSRIRPRPRARIGYQESGTVVQPAFGSGNDRLQGRRTSGRENARRGIEPLFPQRDARRSPKVQW